MNVLSIYRDFYNKYVMQRLDEQMNVLFADALNEVEEHLVQDTDGLWVDDSISIEECE